MLYVSDIHLFAALLSVNSARFLSLQTSHSISSSFMFLAILLPLTLTYCLSSILLISDLSSYPPLPKRVSVSVQLLLHALLIKRQTVTAATTRTVVSCKSSSDGGFESLAPCKHMARVNRKLGPWHTPAQHAGSEGGADDALMC